MATYSEIISKESNRSIDFSDALKKFSERSKIEGYIFIKPIHHTSYGDEDFVLKGKLITQAQCSLSPTIEIQFSIPCHISAYGKITPEFGCGNGISDNIFPYENIGKMFVSIEAYHDYFYSHDNYKNKQNDTHVLYYTRLELDGSKYNYIQNEKDVVSVPNGEHEVNNLEIMREIISISKEHIFRQRVKDMLENEDAVNQPAS